MCQIWLRRRSFPFDGRRGFAADVVDDAVDAADLVDDAVAHLGEDVEGDSGPVGGHEILGFYRSYGDDAVVAAGVAHDAYRADGQEHREDLGGFAVEVGGGEFLEDDLVGVAEDAEALGGDVADDADGQSRAGEGVAPDEGFGQAEDL